MFKKLFNVSMRNDEWHLVSIDVVFKYTLALNWKLIIAECYGMEGFWIELQCTEGVV